MKSVYMIVRSFVGKKAPLRDSRREVYHILWTSKVRPCVKYFTWRVVLNLIPTSTNLLTNGVSIDMICKVCGSSDENILHILYECPFALDSWNKDPRLVMDLIHDIPKNDEF